MSRMDITIIKTLISSLPYYNYQVHEPNHQPYQRRTRQSTFRTVPSLARAHWTTCHRGDWSLPGLSQGLCVPRIMCFSSLWPTTQQSSGDSLLIHAPGPAEHFQERACPGGCVGRGGSKNWDRSRSWQEPWLAPRIHQDNSPSLQSGHPCAQTDRRLWFSLQATSAKRSPQTEVHLFRQYPGCCLRN